MTAADDMRPLLDGGGGGSTWQFPYRWHVAVDGLRPDVADRLAASFPSDGFVHDERRGGSKPYSLNSRALVRFGDRAPCPDLPSVWTRLGRELLAEEYRARMERLCSMSLEGAVLEATLWRYEGGCWLSPHTDVEQKIVSQLMYFNDHWDRSWGGCLQILGSSNPDDVHFEVAPLRGTVVTLIRSDRSWHAVPAVRDDVKVPSRSSLQVTFYRPGMSPRSFPSS